jgi:hypothetical protein
MGNCHICRKCRILTLPLTLAAPPLRWLEKLSEMTAKRPMNTATAIRPTLVLSPEKRTASASPVCRRIAALDRVGSRG